MKFIVAVLLTIFTSMEVLWAQQAYVTNNLGTVGTPGTFISIVDLNTNLATGYVDTTGFNLTHPINVHFVFAGSKAYVVSDTTNLVAIINTAINKVTGLVNDAAFPFNAPILIDIHPTLPKAYVTNQAGGFGDRGTVSVINTNTDTVTTFVLDFLAPLDTPIGVAISPNGLKAYVCNSTGESVTAIDVTTNTASGYVTHDLAHPFNQPIVVAWASDTKAYVTNLNNSMGGFVSVIDATIDNVASYVSVGVFPPFAAPINIVKSFDGTQMFITDTGNNQVYVVDVATDAVVAVWTGTFSFPLGIQVTDGGATAYVANSGNNTVSVIDVASGTETSIINSAFFPFFSPYAIGFSAGIPSAKPLPATCIVGKQKTNRFPSQTEYYNVIEWCASPDATAVKYNIYINGVFIQSAGLNERVFEQHNVTKGVITQYSVTAVNILGVESEPVSISLPQAEQGCNS